MQGRPRRSEEGYNPTEAEKTRAQVSLIPWLAQFAVGNRSLLLLWATNDDDLLWTLGHCP